MSYNINPLFILLVGATILSLVLVTTDSVYVFAQEEEEDDKDEDDEKEKEESKDTKDEEEKEDEKDTKDEDEESKDEDEEDGNNNNNDTSSTTTQIIQDQLTPSSPIVNFTDNTTVATPLPVEESAVKEFNATCKCMTTSSPTSKPTPPNNTNPNGQQQQIIPITNADIIDSKSFGEVVDPAYTSFYNVPNLLDNVINDISFWSQAGQSSFYLKLDNALDNYQVCSMELSVHKPTSTPYLLDVGVSQNYTGVIDQLNERIQFDKCVKNMDEIYMIFDNPSGSFVSIAEIKLFGSKLVGAAEEQTPTPTLQPSSSLIPTLSPPTENATKINIENSTAEVDIKNSTITFKFDPLTATFIGSK